MLNYQRVFGRCMVCGMNSTETKDVDLSEKLRGTPKGQVMASLFGQMMMKLMNHDFFVSLFSDTPMWHMCQNVQMGMGKYLWHSLVRAMHIPNYQLYVLRLKHWSKTWKIHLGISQFIDNFWWMPRCFPLKHTQLGYILAVSSCHQLQGLCTLIGTLEARVKAELHRGRVKI